MLVVNLVVDLKLFLRLNKFLIGNPRKSCKTPNKQPKLTLTFYCWGFRFVPTLQRPQILKRLRTPDSTSQSAGGCAD